MKKIALGALCLLITACSIEKNYYRADCFVTETQLTEDMHKIRSNVIEYYRAVMQREMEYDFKFVQISCKLFGKNNKQLNKEIDKLKRVYAGEKRAKESIKLKEDLKKSLKGLKLDYNQIILLAKELESEYAKIEKEMNAKFAPYRSRANKIIKAIDALDQKQDNWIYIHHQNGLDFLTKIDIYYKMRDVLDDNYNKFNSYYIFINMLEELISEGTLVDSFLKDHPSPVSAKDENFLRPFFHFYGFIPQTTKIGEIIFDAVKKAVSNDKLSRQELSDLLNRTFRYLAEMTSSVVLIQHDITDRIDHDSSVSSYRENKLNNFGGFKRRIITDLVDKNPKFEDFEQKIDRLSTRLAYEIYFKVNIARFLYKEWRNMYYSQIKQLFSNSVKIADRLHELIKNEVITDSTPDKRRYNHNNDMTNISNVKEIAKIGIDKILSTPAGYIDSQKEIKDSLRKSFLETRGAYLKNLGR